MGSRLALPREITLFFLEPRANVTLSPGIRLRGSGDRSRCPFGVSVLIFGSIGWVGGAGVGGGDGIREDKMALTPPTTTVLLSLPQTAAAAFHNFQKQRRKGGITLKGAIAAFLSLTYHLVESDSRIQVSLFLSHW